MDDDEMRVLLEHATAEAQTAALLSGLTLLALRQNGALSSGEIDDVLDAALLMVEKQVGRHAFAAEKTLARLRSVRALLDAHAAA